MYLFDTNLSISILWSFFGHFQKRLSGQAIRRPFIQRHSAQREIKIDTRLVPIKTIPFKPAAAAFYSDLRKFSNMRKNPDVRVIHTWDDPLLAPEHRRWLNRNFGKKMIWFARGGHLGNMYVDKVKEKIVDTALK